MLKTVDKSSSQPRNRTHTVIDDVKAKSECESDENVEGKKMVNGIWITLGR